MTKLYVGIDPGASGGVAYHMPASGAFGCFNMPDTLADLRDRLNELTQTALKSAMGVGRLLPGEAVVLLEKTGGYMPGNSGPAAVKFARHCGSLEGLLVGMRISFDEVAPSKWQKHFGTLPKDKKDRKNAIKDQMQKKYPDLKVTLKTADALALLTYQLDNEKGKQ